MVDYFILHKQIIFGSFAKKSDVKLDIGYNF